MMKQPIRVTLVLILIGILGTFQYAMPFLSNTNQPTQNTTSSFKLDVSYATTTADPSQVRVSDYGDAEQGSFFLQQEDKQGFILSPLLETIVDIKVTGLIARARVTQSFINNSENWVNGMYVFPLPENAAVDHLEMRIGERHILGEIHPKRKARALYQQAKNEGKKASLLVQQRPNMFQNSVANIGPQEKIQVTIEYQQAIQYEDSTFSIRFPTTLTQRYMPPSRIQASGVEITDSGWGITQPLYQEDVKLPHEEPLQKQHKVAINVTLNTGFELSHVDSEFHPIVQTQTHKGVYNVRLKQHMIANQDFVLQWQPKTNQNPEAAHFVQQTQNGVYGLVMLMPPDSRVDSERIKREVIFVIDTSGSMSGESMQQAKMALTYAVEDLAPTDSFNLVDFDSTARQLWPTAQSASQENKAQASQYIAHLSADGGTEMLAALQLALGQPAQDPERLRQVIFITDGSVGNETQLFSYIRDNLQKNRLFTVGIGSAPNSFFMAEAARAGKGSFTYIGSITSVQEKMQTLFSKLTHPVLANLVANFSNDVEFYPRNLPDLYKEQPLMVSYKAPAPIDNLTLSGRLKSRYWQTSMSLHRGAEKNGLDVLWARRKIAQLNRDKMRSSEHEAVNNIILKVAMAHHLVSSMTSLVAVDKTPTALNSGQDIQVKTHAPKGNLHGSLPQTATSAQFQLVLGLLFMGLGLCTVIFTRSR